MKVVFLITLNTTLKLFNYKMHTFAQSDPEKALLIAVLSIGISFFLKNLFRYGAIWFQSQLRMTVVRDVRDRLFEKAMKLPISYYTDERKGDLMARMQSDVGEIENAVISMLELFFREPISIAINLAVLIYLESRANNVLINSSSIYSA